MEEQAIDSKITPVYVSRGLKKRSEISNHMTVLQDRLDVLRLRLHCVMMWVTRQLVP